MSFNNDCTTSVAVIISGTGIKERRGILDIALTRCEYLHTKGFYHFDFYIITGEYQVLSFNTFFKKRTFLRKTHLWGYDISILNHIELESPHKRIQKILDLLYKWKKKRLSDWEWQKDFAKHLKGYDLLTAHFNDAAILAEAAGKKYDIPYCVTWHGSDIHTIPFYDKYARLKTINAIEHAACNFFVSEGLKLISDKLTIIGKKDVLYNGIDRRVFYRYDEDRKRLLRKEYNVDGAKVITFAGNFLPIKNVEILPSLFRNIKARIKSPLVFWLIGDGKLREDIEKQLSAYNLTYNCWGNQPHKKLADFFNCTDLLVLPSKNEGLGLVAIEALACGANAIGSDVGGIKEVLGTEFSIPISNSFVEDLTKKAISILTKPVKQTMSTVFDWDDVSLKENDIYINILRNTTT